MTEPSSVILSIRVVISMSATAPSMTASRCWRCWRALRGIMINQTPFAELYQSSQRSRVRIFAENSPFDLKDRLKERGYRWSDGSERRPKSWWIEIAEEAMEDEFRFLRDEIYRWEDADPPVQRLTAFDRFRGRR